RLWLITGGAQAVEAQDAPVAVTQAPLWGFGRTLAHEHPELCCTLIDLGPTREAVELERLCEELAAGGREGQVARRAAQRDGARLEPWTAPETTPRPRTRAPAAGRPFRLEIDTPGILDELILRETVRKTPGAGEVEIAVRAAGLNFLDVLG